jgi:hypothetical protein
VLIYEKIKVANISRSSIMKAIFIANNKGNVDYVYGQKNIDKLKSA